MPATKVTVNHNGSIRIEGDFEIVDPEGRSYGLAGRTVHRPVPVRAIGEQAVLRRLAQGVRICGCGGGARVAGTEAEGLETRPAGAGPRSGRTVEDTSFHFCETFLIVRPGQISLVRGTFWY